MRQKKITIKDVGEDGDDQNYRQSLNQDDEITDTSVEASTKYKEESNARLKNKAKGNEAKNVSILSISKKRLKLSQSLSSPSSSQSTGSTTSLTVTRNKTQN